MKVWMILCFCFLCVELVNAQEQNQAEKAKIREIKLGGDCFFTDVTMDSAEEALEVAFKSLLMSVQTTLSVGKEIEPKLREKWQHIVLPRADKQWVFAYVYKRDVDTVAVVVKADTAEQTAKLIVAVPVVKADTVREVKILRVVDTLVVVKKDTVVINRRDTIVIKEIQEIKDADESYREGMLNRILTCKKIDEVQHFFVAKKEEGKLMFGKLNTTLALEKCYIVIFSKEGDVVAILDKGATSRRNLTKGTENDHLDNYKGQGKVWFQLY